MATYRGHILGGVVSGVAVSAAHYITPGEPINRSLILNADWQLVAGLVVVATLFALWPDVDTNSKAQNIFIRSAFVIDVILILSGLYLAAALLGLLAMTPILGKHRGWTHSAWAVFVVPAPIVAIPYVLDGVITEVALLFYFAGVVGYFSHLLLDGLIWKRFKLRGGWR